MLGAPPTERAHDPDGLGLGLLGGPRRHRQRARPGSTTHRPRSSRRSPASARTSVTRPIDLLASTGAGFRSSGRGRQQLRTKRRAPAFATRQPGDSFRARRLRLDRTALVCFEQGESNRGDRGVAAVAGGPTLNSIHIEGTVPEDPRREVDSFSPASAARRHRRDEPQRVGVDEKVSARRSLPAR